MDKALGVKFIETIKLYEDDYILVLNKPAGIVVNKSMTAKYLTLQDYLLEYLGLTYNESILDSFESRAGIVHRLDKDTSGTMIIAKNREMFEELQSQFKARKTKKEYIALAHGKFTEKSIEVRAPIQRDTRNRMRFAISRDGREAITQFEVLKETKVENDILTLLTARPLTGRTHQIRVHLCALNHPVVGDPIYASTKKLDFASDNNLLRMYLHSLKLGIFLPYKGSEIIWFESELPSEMAKFA